MVANYTTGDTIDGGAGTDTISMTLGTTIAASISAVETYTITYNTGGGLNASSITGASTMNVLAGTGTLATITNLMTGVTVANGTTAAEAETITIDTVADATLTVKLNDAASGALTITDAATVTITGEDGDLTTSVANTVLDSSDTTSLTIAGADAAYAVSLGAVTGQGSVATLAASTSTSSGTLTVGAYADVGELTSATFTASNANLTFSTGANIGTDSDGSEGESLATVTVSTSNSATLDLGDGKTIFLDSVSDSTTDLTSTWSITTASSSTANIGGIDNTYGITTIDASNNNGTAMSIDSITTASIGSITLGGSGTFAIGAITTTSSTAATIDATNAAGTVNVNVSGMNSNATVNTGTGAATITTVADTSLTTTVALGSGNETTDQIIMSTTATSDVVLKNFETAAADDAIDLSNAGIESRGTGDGSNTLQSLDGAALTTGNVIFQTTTAASNLDVDLGNGTVLIVEGDHASAQLVEQALETGGTHEITLGTASTTEGITNWVIAWDDGTNTYIGVGAIENDSGADGIASNNDETITDIEITTLVTIEGLADVGDLVAANLGGAFIA